MAVIYEVDDLDSRTAALEDAGVRIVWRGDLPDIRTCHLHPRDVGGALVSIHQSAPNGAWRSGGLRAGSRRDDGSDLHRRY